MRDDLLHYYERELTFLRRMGADFARKYPKIAGRLQLEPNKCEDPPVERLLEGFSFLAARIHLKIDDDFSELSESLLTVVYPHFLRPIPSMSLVELELDPEQGKLTTGFKVPRETTLYSRPANGISCRFRTCYDTTLWPVTVAAAQWLSPDRLRPPIRATEPAALRLELHSFADVSFAHLDLTALRLHLSGEATLVYPLYELLCRNCTRIVVRDPTPGSRLPTLTLPGSALRPVGFAEQDGMVPYGRRSFVGYRLLQEYFTFPDKFLFLDLDIFEAIRAAGFGSKAEILFLIGPHERSDWRAIVEAGVSARTIRLGCTPVINLFSQTSEPVLLTRTKHEYQVVPDARRRNTTEIFSVDEVIGVTPGSSEPVRYEPIYAHRHGNGDGRDRGEAFWHATRRPAGWREDGGSDVYLSFVDLSSRATSPGVDAVTARLTCFNGDLPSRLPFTGESGSEGTSDFELEGGGPVGNITALIKPTPVVQPELGRAQFWRLISQLSLNYLSLVETGTEALQEILRLYNAGGSMAGERQIQGILGLRSRPAFARMASEQGPSFVRGLRVELELDEEQFAGGGAYLFASVLEQFLGLYTSINSFSQLSARTRQRKAELREWPPRAGWKALL
jgi:type VI secretion system protein ImpG